MSRQEPSGDALDRIANDQPPFGRLLGLEITLATRERVEAEMVVAPQFGNRNDVMHGGAIMAVADNIGGTATFLNLEPGQKTTTIESKTNFFRAVPLGSRLSAVCEPLHRRRTTMVWQIRLLTKEGKLAAIVTQTQLIYA